MFFNSSVHPRAVRHLPLRLKVDHVAVVNLGTVDIAGFESECLVTGVDSAGRGPAGSRAEPDDDADGDVVHLQPEREVPNGARVY